MVISLIHPSRGRVDKALSTAQKWIFCAGVNVEHILSVDHDDRWDAYFGVFALNHLPSVKIVNNNTSVVEATNHAAKSATGDILVYLSDDFKCPDNWGQLIIEQFQGVTTPMLLKVDDCLQNFGARVLTIPIMNRQLYEKLGYFWHPGYKSMFVDEDLYNTAEKLRALKFAPQLKFPHEHVCNGKAPDDETYRRSSANWNQGQEFFKQRKAAGFPL